MVPALSQDLRVFLDVESRLSEALAPFEPPDFLDDLVREDTRQAVQLVQRTTQWARLVVENPKRIPARGKPAKQAIGAYQELFVFLLDHVGRRARFLRDSHAVHAGEPPFKDLLAHDEILRNTLIPVSSASTRDDLIDALEDYVDQVTVADVYGDPTHTFRPLAEVLADL
jgi:hypothetical protein